MKENTGNFLLNFFFSSLAVYLKRLTPLVFWLQKSSKQDSSLIGLQYKVHESLLQLITKSKYLIFNLNK